MALSPPTGLTPIDQRNIDQLRTALKQSADTPNILTLDEFRRFAPLYTKPATENAVPTQSPELRALAEEFQQRLNYYKPTHIVRSKHDATVLLRLPQIFTPLRPLSHTDANEQAINANYAHRHSDLPKVWSTAQNLMTSALFQEQAAPEQLERIAQATAETKEIMEELDRAYGRTPATAAGPNSVETSLAAGDFDDL